MTINAKQLEVLKGDYLDNCRKNSDESIEDTDVIIGMLDMAISNFHDWLKEKGY